MYYNEAASNTLDYLLTLCFNGLTKQSTNTVLISLHVVPN